MVAAGNSDAYFEAGLHCWDMAAGNLIVTEAGGTVLSLKGPYTEELDSATTNAAII